MGSADAGMDQEMPGPVFYGPALQAAVQDGQVSMATLDDMVSRILTEMFRFNEFNNPPTGSTSATVTTTAHQDTATTVAEDGTVLLKNSGGTLPLSASDGGSVAVIGPAASAQPDYTGGGSAYVTAPFHVTPLQGLQAAAGSGTTVSYTQGLPTDTSLSAIPSADLSPAYAPTGYGGSYTGTLTAPETGTYVLAFQNPGNYNVTNLSLNGKIILANPGTPPVSTYSVGVNLSGRPEVHAHDQRQWPVGQPELGHPVRPGPGHQPGGDRGQGGEHRGGRGVRRHRVRGGRPGQPQPAVRAERADLRGGRGQPAHRGGARRGRPRGDAVAQPGGGRGGRLVPGREQRHRAGHVLFGQTDPSGHLPVTFPVDLSQVPASSPSQFPGTGGQVQYSEGIDVGYRYYDANNETPLFPFGYGLSYTTFAFSHLQVTPQQIQNASSNPGPTSCGVQRPGQPPGDRLGHRDQHRQGGRLGGRAAVPGRPGRRQ